MAKTSRRVEIKKKVCDELDVEINSIKVRIERLKTNFVEALKKEEDKLEELEIKKEFYA